MNCKSIKLVLLGGLLGTVLTIGITVNVYETKISTIENNKNMEIIQLKTEKSNMEKDISTYKYLYSSQENDIVGYKLDTNKAKEELKTLQDKIYISKEKELKVSRGDYQNKDLSQYEIMTTDELNRWIAQRAPSDSPFIGKAETFLKISQHENLDPKFLIASSALESGWGRSNIAKLKSNYFGITAYNDTPLDSAKQFSSGLDSGLAEGAHWIKQYYYNEGQQTLDSMINGKKAYCQLNNGQPSEKWIPQITSIIYDTTGNNS